MMHLKLDQIMINATPPPKIGFQKPLSIFEAIAKQNEKAKNSEPVKNDSEYVKPVIEEQLNNEFLFPIRMLF